jgi:S1-C subfamily serine protease
MKDEKGKMEQPASFFSLLLSSFRLHPSAFRTLVTRHCFFCLSLLCISLAGLGIAPESGAAQEPKRPPTLSTEARAQVRRAIASVGLVVVRSTAEAGGLRPKGSAVIIRSDGLVVTNYHVIADPNRAGRLYEEIYLTLASDGVVSNTDSTAYRLKPAVISRELDLALLRVDREGGDPASASMVFPAIELGNSQAVQMLDDLTIIGFPEKGGSTVTISRGVVEGKDVLGNWIKTDARVIHGNSGGAAVNDEGRLIGIPTKVVADIQPIDKNGDGFPDDYKLYGAVGFLRPSHLVANMLAQLDRPTALLPGNKGPIKSQPGVLPPAETVTVRGLVKSVDGGKPLAGVLIGLLPQGAEAVTEATLLTWGGTNSEGQFVLNKQVPPGRYTLKAKALGYQSYTREIEITQRSPQLIVEMQMAR